MKKLEQLRDFDALRVSLASPEQILSWSYGEVTEPETINYRTYKAERNGLFDERIFGPIKDFECYCGKYRRVRYKGVICDKCGVEVIHSRVRRERMGHITLAVPCAHAWFFRSVPSPIRILLDVPSHQLEDVLYFAAFLITDLDSKKRDKVLAALKDSVQKEQEDVREGYEGQMAEVASSKKQESRGKGKGQKGRKGTASNAVSEERLELEKEALELKTKQKIAALREEMAVALDKIEGRYQRLAKRLEDLKLRTVIPELEYAELEEYVEQFAETKMGAEALSVVLEKLDLKELIADLQEKISVSRSSQRTDFYRRRLRLAEGFLKAEVDPAWTILKFLPVIPPDLRPMVQLEGGRFATSDHNDLYRRVLNRNNRLHHLLDLGAPEIIVRNEKRMLQEAVDALLFGPRGSTVPSRGQKELRSLSDLLKGKKGRFRRNLLGKRVDYSGRSVIVVGPHLNLDQCGVPKEMALELFKPFVLRELMLEGLAPNLKSARRSFEARVPEVWGILERLVKDHPVLLNRAPTLHRLGIVAFYPQLVEGEAIQLHPCVCAGFNADFDGDQMAVHVPLSENAKREARELMLSTKNLRLPSSGAAVTLPSKDMLVGLYYLTGVAQDSSKKRYFTDSQEALLAYEHRQIGVRELVSVRMDGDLIPTTAGRILFNQVLPVSFAYFNEAVTRANKAARKLIEQCMETEGETRTAKLVDALKVLGFKFSTLSGVSMAITDGKIVENREDVLNEANAKVAEIDLNYRRGLVTKAEKARLSEQVWMDTTAQLDELTWNNLDEENPIKMLVSSGARGNRDQVKQIAGMKGLVVDPLGRVVELPIRSNYRIGLSCFEYFSGVRGARKGVVDTALKTADAGYLTRRLVDVAQSVIIRTEDCETKRGIRVRRKEENVLVDFGERLVGRVLVEDIPKIAKAGGLVTVEMSEQIEADEKITEVLVRSPLTCTVDYELGICAQCFGLDLATQKMVEVGVPVGVIAAQSIGEPGTQLTLRTYHAGGIVGKDITQGLPRVEELFEARTPKYQGIVSEVDGKVKLTERDEGGGYLIAVTPAKGKSAVVYTTDPIHELKVADGDLVAVGTALTDGDIDPQKLLEVAGEEAVMRYLVAEIQKVYSSQGVGLDDKHVETIIRKMFSKVRIKSSGDTTLLVGEVVSPGVWREKSREAKAAGGKPARAEKVLLGITQASLATDSFLAAASFQRTVGVLTEAAVFGKIDLLRGLKENVIVGRPIPVGERARIKNS